MQHSLTPVILLRAALSHTSNITPRSTLSHHYYYSMQHSLTPVSILHAALSHTRIMTPSSTHTSIITPSVHSRATLHYIADRNWHCDKSPLQQRRKAAWTHEVLRTPLSAVTHHSVHSCTTSSSSLYRPLGKPLQTVS